MRPARPGEALGSPSRTAMLVALWRALAHLGITSVPGFADPQARALLSGWFWRAMMQRADRWAATKQPPPKNLVNAVDGVILRVAFIDAVLAEVALKQVVILGAGLDTRAWRLDALRGARIFEVDHPATQTYKRAHAAALGPTLGEHHFVPVDFTVDDLDQALEAAGHRTDVPTAWVWEGVIMYLDDAALRRTLEVVARRSAPGSTLVAHYHEPESTPQHRKPRWLFFLWLGEPQIGLRSRETMAGEIARVGLRIDEDTGIAEQAARVGGTPPTHPRALVSRILVATVGS